MNSNEPHFTEKIAICIGGITMQQGKVKYTKKLNNDFSDSYIFSFPVDCRLKVYFTQSEIEDLKDTDEKFNLFDEKLRQLVEKKVFLVKRHFDECVSIPLPKEELAALKNENP